MNSQIQKWGNSLAIRIPKNIAQKLNLQPGSNIELNTKNQDIIISKTKSELDSILNKINSDNIHHEIFDNDKNFGNESW